MQPFGMGGRSRVGKGGAGTGSAATLATSFLTPSKDIRPDSEALASVPAK